MSGVTDPAEAYFKDGSWGWDGTLWRKLPMVWGYSDRYAESLSEIDVSAADHNLDFTAVSDGEVWVINGISAFCSTANPAQIQLLLRLSAATYYLKVQTTVVAWQVELILGTWVLKKDDYVRAFFDNCTLNDDLYAQAFGYKMKIAE